MNRIKGARRGWLRNAALAVLSAGLLASGTANAQSAPKEVRIGFQKYGTLVILKARGTLEKRLAEKGIEVKWTEFPFGPPLLEAINLGSLDVGTVGEAPPIFAQAAGADLVYIGYEPAAPAAEALLVPKDSPLRSVAELKGKRVAVAKGSNANYLLVKLLENAGLKYGDVEVSYLAPADARAAFESGRVAAWSIWDPFYASAEKQLGARVLADGKGAVANHQYYLASRAFAEKHPDIVTILIEEIDRVDQWGAQNPKEVAKFIAPLIGVDLPIAETAAGRLGYGIKPVTPAVIAAQQSIADRFFELKLVPKQIRVSDALPREVRR
ncbi:sulfonate ABC transporter substrate-binding protein [Methyloversatilis universalis]|uniref:sulfonate ABC transporter substrate-binding protein n=1 Tax=Methyloversatilis universalis TaxID=378211 RepID=UPI0003696C50|nr:sulfonate ABC transporter substrate-binding protein [Methyloversatilis universalis]